MVNFTKFELVEKFNVAGNKENGEGATGGAAEVPGGTVTIHYPLKYFNCA